jgi:hypothetical protein
MSYRGDHLGFQVDKKKPHTHFIKSNQRDFPLLFFSLSNGFVVSNKNNAQTFSIGFYIKFDL